MKNNRIIEDYYFAFLERKELEKRIEFFKTLLYKVIKDMNLRKISFSELKTIHSIFKFAKENNYLSLDEIKEISSCLLNMEVYYTPVDIEEFNQICHELQGEILEQTSGSRK